MVNISKIGDSAIKFTFTDNDRYLYNGEITVPLNSLILEIDSSELIIFKKVDGDVFVTFLIENSNFSSKEALIEWFEENMVAPQGGGGGGGVTSGQVQTMIDDSVSGFADSVLYNSTSKYVEFYHGGTGGTKVYEFDASDFVIDGMIDDVRIETISGVSYLVIDFNTASGKEDIQIPLTDIFDPSNYYTKTEVDGIVSGKADSSAVTEEISAAVSGKADSSAVTQEISAAVSGKVDTSTYTAYTAATEAVLSGKTSVVNLTQAEYDALVTGGTVDPTVLYNITDATPIDMSQYWTSAETNSAITQAVSGKQDTLISGTNIKTINNESILGSGNIDIQGGGGKAISAGTNISVTTGETADTINCTLNISNGTGTKSIKIGDGVSASGILSFAQGDDAKASGEWSTAFGRGKSTQNYTFSANSGQAKKGFSSAFGASIANNAYGFATGAGSNANGHSSFVSGWYTNSNNNYEAAFGNYNNSVSASTTFGDSGNTLFSVGNGTDNNARHNAFEIRQNGDIYYFDGTNDVKLQDKFSSLDTTIGNINSVLNNI